MLDLRLCEFKFPISPLVISTIKENASKVNNYPVYEKLYQTLQEYTGYPENWILVGDGSNELITILSQDLLQEGDKVVVLKPDFPMYAVQALRNKAFIEKVDCFQNNFQIPYEKVINTCKGAKILWLSNPNNPTGGYTNLNVLRKIIESVDCLVCVDECYFNYHGETVLPWVKEYANLIVLRSFSKTHGLAGLRFGFAIANPKIIEKTKSYFKFEVNGLAVEAAMSAIKDEQYYHKYWQKIKEERDYMAEKIRGSGLQVHDSRTTFLCIKVGKGEELREWLQKQEISLKVAYDLSEWLRFGIGTRKMNQEFLTVLKKYFKKAIPSLA